MTTTTPSGLAAYAREARRLPYPPARRAIRLAAGVSQQLVADELRVDRATVTRYELGERTPRGELLISYIRLLDELREAIEPRDTSSPLGASSTQEVGRGRVQSP